jgi:hypothetical protein
MVHAIGFGKTKPICRRGPGRAQTGGASSGAGAPAYCAKQTQFCQPGVRPEGRGVRRIVQTNPIRPPQGGLGAAPKPIVQNKANLPGRRPEGEMCETNPISKRVSSVKYQVVGRASRVATPQDLLASNFTLHTSNSAEGQSCKTNPISGRRGREKTKNVRRSAKVNLWPARSKKSNAKNL